MLCQTGQMGVEIRKLNRVKLSVRVVLEILCMKESNPWKEVGHLCSKLLTQAEVKGESCYAQPPCALDSKQEKCVDTMLSLGRVCVPGMIIIFINVKQWEKFLALNFCFVLVFFSRSRLA